MKPVYSTEEAVAPAAVQAEQENSMLNHYKKFIHLRDYSKALTYGELESVKIGNPAVAAFLRTHPDESVFVLHNLSSEETTIALPANLTAYKTILFRHKAADIDNNMLQLPAYSSLILAR